jgi:ABC-type multidrug transport system ATPase subunit
MENWSNGESLCMLLALAMASCEKIFCWTKGTSGLDDETQKRLENSIVYYVKMNGTAVLLVVQNKDIAERLLAP